MEWSIFSPLTGVAAKLLRKSSTCFGPSSLFRFVLYSQQKSGQGRAKAKAKAKMKAKAKTSRGHATLRNGLALVSGREWRGTTLTLTLAHLERNKRASEREEKGVPGPKPKVPFLIHSAIPLPCHPSTGTLTMTDLSSCHQQSTQCDVMWFDLAFNCPYVRNVSRN